VHMAGEILPELDVLADTLGVEATRRGFYTNTFTTATSWLGWHQDQYGIEGVESSVEKIITASVDTSGGKHAVAFRPIGKVRHSHERFPCIADHSSHHHPKFPHGHRRWESAGLESRSSCPRLRSTRWRANS
jgi:hypothetical protein